MAVSQFGRPSFGLLQHAAQSRLYGSLEFTPVVTLSFMDPERLNINGDTPETPLIAKRGVTKSGTPKNVGHVLSVVYFVLCT